MVFVNLTGDDDDAAGSGRKLINIGMINDAKRIPKHKNAFENLANRENRNTYVALNQQLSEVFQRFSRFQ